MCSDTFLFSVNCSFIWTSFNGTGNVWKCAEWTKPVSLNFGMWFHTFGRCKNVCPKRSCLKLRPFFNSRTVDENRRATTQSRRQDRFSVRVWTDILGDWLIRLYDFPSRLIRNMYHNSLVHIVPDFVEMNLNMTTGVVLEKCGSG
jgi:hypothetical protein